MQLDLSFNSNRDLQVKERTDAEKARREEEDEREDNAEANYDEAENYRWGIHPDIFSHSDSDQD